MKIDIYFNDLKPEKQQELINLFGGENGNYDVTPIASIEMEDTDKLIKSESETITAGRCCISD